MWFRDDRLRSVFEAQTGLRVVAHGRMDLYEPNGGLQLYVESIQPAGVGDLALRFEALKARLAAEGLFETARKRRLPQPPADDRGHHEPDRRRVEGHLPRARTALAAGPGRPRRGPGPGRERAGQPRLRVPTARSPHGQAGRRGPVRPRPDGDDHRPGWRFARGPVGVQRRARRPGGRGASRAGRLGRRARGRRDARGLRGGRAGADAVGGRRDRRAGPHRVHRQPRRRPPPAGRGRRRDA